MSGSTKLHVACKFAKLQTWSALRAGKRLGMESAVAWIGILGRTLRTEGKVRHRRIGTIIRQPFDQGVARAALGAINEGVAEAPISRITHFGKAFVAGKVVRRKLNMFRERCFTDVNLKVRDSFRRDRSL